MIDRPSKIAAVIAMAISAVSFGLLIWSVIDGYFVTQPVRGMGSSFGLWIYSVMAAIVSLIPYIIDGIQNIKRIILKIDKTLNIVLTAMIIGALPMLFYMGGAADVVCSVLWNLYYLLLFVLELIATIRDCRNTWR